MGDAQSMHIPCTIHAHWPRILAAARCVHCARRTGSAEGLRQRGVASIAEAGCEDPGDPFRAWLWWPLLDPQPREERTGDGTARSALRALPTQTPAGGAMGWDHTASARTPAASARVRGKAKDARSLEFKFR